MTPAEMVESHPVVAPSNGSVEKLTPPGIIHGNTVREMRQIRSDLPSEQETLFWTRNSLAGHASKLWHVYHS